MIRAVNGKKQVTCSYQGHHRELCVHVVGYKNDRPQILAFQFGGSSSKGLVIGGDWRCMVLNEIRDIRLQDGQWYSPDNHSRPQTCVDRIIAEVRY
ncbi:hypothetical protein [Ancylobacter sp. Lp-2]|uniref:hypothetical protein n=1 Tax=Ancylobacter sp. Lp-2 TaxID=2881339 RepID=UPI001E54D59F|nr:hypothetical protein [Ancylobacter sp. Lp-2]